jgi:tol-pal system protein YbgF
MPIHTLLLAGFLVAPTLASGNKDIERLYLQIAALQSEVAQLRRSNDDTLKELRRLNEVLAEQNAFIKKGAQDQQRQAEAEQIAHKEIADAVAACRDRPQAVPAASAANLGRDDSAPLAPVNGNSAPSGAASTAAQPADKELYTQAYADYARGNYDLAIQAFQEFIRRSPTDSLADNAQYWIGDCLFGKREYAAAVTAWDELLRQYPGTEKIPDARFKKAMALEKMGRRSQALLEFRYVFEHFPNSEAGRRAREKVQSQ